MNKSTLLSVVFIGIMASYGIQVFMQQKVYPAIGLVKESTSTYRIEVSKEEYNTLRQMRDDQKNCDCIMHVYGASDTRQPCPRGLKGIR
ncbi:MAG: hypothetical protein JWO03_2518 [Bacteroidetes bacterium]|nr:hypothetical protein [Bacteroidota bacterium]